MTTRIAMLCALAACSRSREPKRDKPSAEPPPRVALVAAGRDPQIVASTLLEPFAPDHDARRAPGHRAGDPGHAARSSPSHAFTMTTDFGFRAAEVDGRRHATFDVAMGAAALLRARHDAQHTTGWPLTVVRGARGDLRSLSTGSSRTDATALEETFGRTSSAWMFVPVPSEPIGVGARAGGPRESR